MPLTQVADFKIDYLQILDENGKVDAKLDPKIPKDELLRLYRSMVLSREFDQRMLRLQRQGRIGTFPPSTGQEACSAGTAMAMKDTDWYVGAFRDVNLRYLRGESLVKYLVFHRGYEEGNYKIAERNFPLAIPIGTHVPHAVGLAYARRHLGDKDFAVVTTMGDGATSEGDFHEAMNFAAVWDAPVVFICHNNQWAISVPRKKQTRSETIAQKAIAYGMPGLQVDGNDVLAMYKASKDALEHARAGKGPYFIEAVTYRLMMHTTADDPKKYRDEEEVKKWWKRDPNTRFRIYLENKKLWDEKKEDALQKEVKDEIEGMVKEMEAVTEFKPDLGFDHVFAESVPYIERQRKEFLDALPLQRGESDG
ncbi:pyruvate dehydrogenase (acetyl-transferring) E1 component subunit alpha [bacterium]|nr:pyruvate dehydrogenase (acetyl-transferring) E1 component subunit alpha [bacterium]